MKGLAEELNNLSIRVTSFPLDALRHGNYDRVGYAAEGISSLDIIGTCDEYSLRLKFRTKSEEINKKSKESH